MQGFGFCILFQRLISGETVLTAIDFWGNSLNRKLFVLEDMNANELLYFIVDKSNLA